MSERNKNNETKREMQQNHHKMSIKKKQFSVKHLLRWNSEQGFFLSSRRLLLW